MASVATKSEGMELGGYKFLITKGNVDITQDLLGGYPGRKVQDVETVLPYCSSEVGDLTVPMNILLEAFKEIDSSDILTSQFDISFTSKDSELGSGGYLAVFAGSPFIAFEKAPELLLPLGRGERSTTLREASFLELLFASHLVAALGLISKSDAGTLEKAELEEERLRYFYDEEQLSYSRVGKWEYFDSAVSQALNSGFVQRKYVLDVVDHYGNEEHIPTLSQVGDFSWLK